MAGIFTRRERVARKKKYPRSPKKKKVITPPNNKDRPRIQKYSKLSSSHETFKKYVYEGWSYYQLARAFNVTEEQVKDYIDSNPLEFPP